MERKLNLMRLSESDSAQQQVLFAFVVEPHRGSFSKHEMSFFEKELLLVSLENVPLCRSLNYSESPAFDCP